MKISLEKRGHGATGPPFWPNTFFWQILQLWGLTNGIFSPVHLAYMFQLLYVKSTTSLLVRPRFLTKNVSTNECQVHQEVIYGIKTHKINRVVSQHFQKRKENSFVPLVNIIDLTRSVSSYLRLTLEVSQWTALADALDPAGWIIKKVKSFDFKLFI